MPLQFPGRLTVAVLAVAFFAVILVRNMLKARRLPLPPGPKGYPLIGNLFDLPKQDAKPWVHWAAHKQLYGPISSVSILGTRMIIINDYDMAANLLKRDAVSDRPQQTFIRTL